MGMLSEVLGPALINTHLVAVDVAAGDGAGLLPAVRLEHVPVRRVDEGVCRSLAAAVHDDPDVPASVLGLKLPLSIEESAACHYVLGLAHPGGKRLLEGLSFESAAAARANRVR